ncbi:MAG: hypothetical protein II839_11485 [Kiritimatiellae bacterium]|nr:hypothetical protein [Kiritimatiellia bacterium]
MKILVSAGPTREPIDAVRFLSNRSTGRMGIAVARAAAEAGHEVALVLGPVAIEPPDGVRVVRVETALEMLAALRAELPAADALVMAAAVADFRPAAPAARKLHKGEMPAAIQLVRNPDILAGLRPLKGNRIFCGFAAETDDVLASAARKLARKGLDLIVANDVTAPGAGFAVDTNVVTVLRPGAAPERWPLLSKIDVARRLVALLETLATERPAP